MRIAPCVPRKCLRGRDCAQGGRQASGWRRAGAGPPTSHGTGGDDARRLNKQQSTARARAGGIAGAAGALMRFFPCRHRFVICVLCQRVAGWLAGCSAGLPTNMIIEYSMPVCVLETSSGTQSRDGLPCCVAFVVLFRAPITHTRARQQQARQQPDTRIARHQQTARQGGEQTDTRIARHQQTARQGGDARGEIEGHALFQRRRAEVGWWTAFALALPSVSWAVCCGGRRGAMRPGCAATESITRPVCTRARWAATTAAATRPRGRGRRVSDFG
jgi:hypothetical protein